MVASLIANILGAKDLFGLKTSDQTFSSFHICIVGENDLDKSMQAPARHMIDTMQIHLYP